MSTLKVNAIEKKDADQTLTVKDATLTGATLTNATITTGTFPGKLFAGMKVFTATGTWTKPSNVTAVYVILTGAGGCGQARSSGSDRASGGSGGGTAIKWITSGLGSTETITVGPAGNVAGTTGGTTSFGAHCSASGGGGGNQNANPNQPGVGIDGDINIRGGMGVRGHTDSFDTMGGSSYWGGGTSFGVGTNTGWVSYGAGSGDGNSGGAVSGSGICVVYEYV